MRDYSDPLTKRQTEVLDFMWSFYLDNDQLPTAAEISKRFQFASANAAYEHEFALLMKGYLARNVVGKFKFTPKARELLEEPEPTQST